MRFDQPEEGEVTVTNSWETTIHKMLVEVAQGKPIIDLESYVRLVAWAVLKANAMHPEWAQAKLLALPGDTEIVDRLAAILVDGEPVERMAI